jgi:CDP-paratose 2-epimerase
MKVLVTGGCGFIGSSVAFHLHEKGNRVMVMDNLVRRGSEANLVELQRRGISFTHGDVRNIEDLANLPTGIDLICDTSAQPSVVSGYSNPLFDITNNGVGAIHILEYARRYKTPIIFWSSNRVYGADRLNALPRRQTDTRLEWDPGAWDRIEKVERPGGFDPLHGISEEFSVDGGQRSIYGLSKLIADVACQEYAQAFDLPVIVNRFGVISGTGQFGSSDQGWVVWWAVAHWFGLPLKYLGWHGKQVRDVLFVDDVLSLLDFQISQLPKFRGEVFNVGGGFQNSISLLEATRTMEEISGRSTSVTLEDTPRKGDIALYFTDNRKVRRLTAWNPKVGLKEGLSSIFEWIRANESELSRRYLSAG